MSGLARRDTPAVATLASDLFRPLPTPARHTLERPCRPQRAAPQAVRAAIRSNQTNHITPRNDRRRLLGDAPRPAYLVPPACVPWPDCGTLDPFRCSTIRLRWTTPERTRDPSPLHSGAECLGSYDCCSTTSGRLRDPFRRRRPAFRFADSATLLDAPLFACASRSAFPEQVGSEAVGCAKAAGGRYP